MAKSTLGDDIDALFAAPLTAFTGARNALAARLKQGGSADEAERVKALGKPSVSAWAVNQLYWKHRKAFDRLIETGQSLRQAQASHVRGPLEARRGALSDLLHLAAALLRDSGHNPTPDVTRRIATTLEAMSAYASLPDSPSPGHLTADLDPPGFESLAALIPGSGVKVPAKGAAPVSGVRERKETGQTTIAAAKASLQNAERVLKEVRAKARDAEVALKKANAEAKEAEKHKREAEELLEKASAASEEARRSARSVEADAAAAKKALENAERTVEKASRELRLLRGH